MNILSIFIALFAFGFLIFVHELGHYLAARAFHVKIYEFSIGMGPKLLWYDSKKTGIRYKLCMLPFGGYVSMGDGQDDAAESDDPQALSNQKAWKRFIIMAAGGVVNLIIGVILMFVVVVGSVMGTTVVAEFPEDMVYEGVSTQEDGLQVGDTIYSIDGRRVHITMEMDYAIMRQGIEPIEVVVIRDGQKVALTVEFPTEQASGEIVGTRDFLVYAQNKTFSGVIKETFYRSTCTVRMIWESIWDLITGRYGIGAVSGPVGITATVSEATSYGFMSVLYLVSIISMNLGLVNLFPLPALDGGRLFFLLIEMIFRKPVPRDIEAKIHTVGLLVLLGFALFITVLDIRAFFP